MRSQRAFTLIELLVAMAITVLVSAAALAGWRAVTNVERALAKVQTELAVLERAFLMLERDIGQLTARAIKDELGGERSALEYSNYDGIAIEFTRAGWFNPAPELTPPRSELQRVAYRLQDDKLLRRTWYHLDRMVEGEHVDRQVLGDVTELTWRFLDSAGDWHETWPPTNSFNSDPDAPFPLPVAMELNLSLAELGSLSRWFEVP
ncbi:MAG: type II secretion system minor pseudopilin GspJ [Pseudomonadota bacterium]